MAKHTPLTKEYFEKHLEKGFKIHAKEIKTHVTKEVGDLAAMTAREFDKVHEKLNVIDAKTGGHEKRLARVEDAIGMPKTV